MCWCQRYKLEPREAFKHHPAEVRAERLRRQTNCGAPRSDETTDGLVAYPRREPVGWCAVEPRLNYRASCASIACPGLGRAEDKSDARVWAVTCVFVRAGYRRRGVSYALARAAVDFRGRAGRGRSRAIRCSPSRGRRSPGGAACRQPRHLRGGRVRGGGPADAAACGDADGVLSARMICLACGMDARIKSGHDDRRGWCVPPSPGVRPRPNATLSREGRG